MSTNHDLTHQPDLHQKSGTGPVRSQKPVYRSFLPPCNHRCPAGEDIQGWLALAQAGKYEAAWQLLIADNPLPAVHGRACYHPCEQACNRVAVDQAVSIHAVERFLGDMALAKGWQPKFSAQPSGKKILIIGAGPSGLSCAWHLRRAGHAVELHDAGPMAGGMMHFGIPSYRLPRDVLEAEIQRILSPDLNSSGIKLVLNSRVDDVPALKKSGGFDAVFMAIGAHLAKRIDIPARDSARIFDAVSYLRSVEQGEAPKLGRRVAIYGGGNAAMDVARTAQRLGAEEATIIYRRDQEHMSAHPAERDEAMQEGIRIHWLRSISHFDASQLRVEIMRLDDDGHVVPTGEFETLEADSVVLALGQNVDTTVLDHIPGMQFNDDGVVHVDANMMTSVPGIFAGGDMVPSERTIATATGHGKKAAHCIDAWLQGENYRKPPSSELEPVPELHLWFNTEAQASTQAVISPAQRAHGFDEITGGLSEKQARFEAGRCFSCGNCFECDGCFGACPEHAVIKLGPGRGYRFDYDRCTGCAACFNQCPCHAIVMTPETVNAKRESAR